jgi:hypothetical protein
MFPPDRPAHGEVGCRLGAAIWGPRRVRLRRTDMVGPGGPTYDRPCQAGSAKGGLTYHSHAARASRESVTEYNLHHRSDHGRRSSVPCSVPVRISPEEFLRAGIHLLVIDLFPASPRDPEGIHKVIWDQFLDDDFMLPPDKPLTLASYIGGPIPETFVNATAVGLPLPEMPLFLTPEEYVPVPLEPTYQSASDEVPAFWQSAKEVADTQAMPAPKARGCKRGEQTVIHSRSQRAASGCPLNARLTNARERNQPRVLGTARPFRRIAVRRDPHTRWHASRAR